MRKHELFWDWVQYGGSAILVGYIIGRMAIHLLTCQCH